MEKLKFKDYFTNKKLDKRKWKITISGGGFGNRELQYYTSKNDNLFIDNEGLHIKAIKENYQGANYTSAKIYTKKSFRYGTINIIAKLPRGKGAWPAFWLLSNSIRLGEKWPLCGEIDMMEYAGYNKDKIHFSLHCQQYNHKLNNHYTKIKKIANVEDEFKTYSLVWKKDSMEYYIDNILCAKFTKGENNKDTSHLGWPFNNKFYLIINLAVGGFFGGQVDDNDLPFELIIKSVEVIEN